ncbi:MAG: hypothetical protein RR317_01625, partial [Bilophila sp.]
MALGCLLELSPFASEALAADSSASRKTSGRSRKKKATSRSRKTDSRRTNTAKDSSKQFAPKQQPAAKSLPPDQAQPQMQPEAIAKPLQKPLIHADEPDLAPASSTKITSKQDADLPANAPEEVRDYLVKMRNYDIPFPGDVILPPSGQVLLNTVMARLDRLQGHIGHGHFYLLGLDEAISYAKRPAIGAFTRQEL